MTAEEKRVSELTGEISRIKKHLTNESGRMANKDVHEEILYLGRLLTEKNELTGYDEDAPFLYFDDGEWMREVKGFVGEPAGQEDILHQPLLVGDTVGLICEDGSVFPRLVMQDLPSQKTIYERKAKKIKDCSQLDIYDAGAATFTISLRSPVEEYAQSLRQGMEMQL